MIYIGLLLLIIFIIAYIYVLIEGFDGAAGAKIKIWGELDAVLYINLESRPDRNKMALALLDSLHIPVGQSHKISGVHIPQNGHKGCIQSHIIALRMAKMNKWGSVLILEDDAELALSVDQFISNITNMLGKLKEIAAPAYDVIMLGTANAEKGEGPVSNIKRIRRATTGTAYIIGAHYYDKMIALFEYLNGMMSDTGWTNGNGEEFALDQNWYKMQQYDNWYGFVEDPIRQANIQSSTNNRI
jgi:hypothetical protein